MGRRQGLKKGNFNILTIQRSLSRVNVNIFKALLSSSIWLHALLILIFQVSSCSFLQMIAPALTKDQVAPSSFQIYWKSFGRYGVLSLEILTNLSVSIHGTSSFHSLFLLPTHSLIGWIPQNSVIFLASYSIFVLLNMLYI